MAKVLKGGTIVTSKETYKADIRIDGEKIVAIGKVVELPGDEVISVKGYNLLPGGIDGHTHFDLDVGTTVTADDFKTGTKAALVGGTTTIIDFVNHVKGKTLHECLDIYKEKTQDTCFCDYGLHMSISEWNDDISKEMETIVNKEGIPSFKMYMAYKDVLQVEDATIYKALERAKELNAVALFHCENGDLICEKVNGLKKEGKLKPVYHPISRPNLVEREAIGRLISIGQLVDYPVFVVHLSTEEGLDEIRHRRSEGAKVLIETCPQYLLLNDSLYGSESDDSFEGAKYVISPPLRKDKDRESLWNGLKNGEIQIVSTDHCSFNFHGQKDIGKDDFSKIPNGGPGVEHRMVLLYTNGVLRNKISLNKFVELTATNPAKVFGMYPRKGELAVGSDADIVVISENEEYTIRAKDQMQNVDYTPYEGFKSKVKIKNVFLRGNEVVRDGKFVENNLKGDYIKRKNCSCEVN